MAKQLVNIGVSPNTGGDPARIAFEKVNSNNSELYTALGADVVTGVLPLALPITKGGTGATTKEDARTNLGLGTAALLNVEDLPSDTEYVLPKASDSILGGVKVGSGLSIDMDGVLTAQAQGGSVTSVNGELGDVVVNAENLTTLNGNTQQAINDRGGATWYAKSGGYDLNSRVILGSGDIVRPTAPNNTVDPNVDMTGWVIERDYVDLIDFIPKSEHVSIINRISAYDCTVALTKAHALGKRIEISVSGKYVFKTAFTTDKAFNLASKVDGVVFDYSSMPSSTSLQSGIYVTGSVTKIADLATNITLGTRSIELESTTGLKSGDWICIFNPATSSYSQFRPYYKAGEWVQILSISGNTISTVGYLYASYNIEDVEIYKMNSVPVSISGNRIKFQDLTGNCNYMVSVSMCEKPIVNIDFELSNHAGIRFDRCVYPKSYYCSGKNFGKSTEETNYAIAISNSQHARIIGGNMYAARHAITMGGRANICAVVCRDNRVFDATLITSPTFSYGAADMHGNVEDCSYERCVIIGGSKLGGGGNNFYKDCVIHGDSTHGKIGHVAEILGGSHKWINCEMYAYGNPIEVNRGVFDVGGNSEVFNEYSVRDTDIEVIGGKITARSFSNTTSMLLAKNLGSSAELNLVFKGVECDLNALGSFVRVSLVGGVAKSQRIICDEITTNIYPQLGFVVHAGDDKPYLVFPHRIQKQSGVVTMTTTASNVTSANTQNFKFPYPRKPTSNLSVRGISGATDFGGQVITPSTLAIGVTSIRPQVRSQDNMVAGVDFEFCWEVGLSEC